MNEACVKELMTYQLAFTEVPLNYDGELATVLAHYNDGSFTLRRRMSKDWLKALVKHHERRSEHTVADIKLAVTYREEGNALYRSKSDTKQTNLIKAGQRYSQAIFAAPAKTEALALAYANRAMVLQELQYYQQAYDDCFCALETSKYPQRLLQKIQARQAFCALNLKDTAKLTSHLAELEGSSLNENFTQRVKELKTGLEGLLNEEKSKVNRAEKDKELEWPNTEATEIIDSNDAKRGRYMIAARPIKSGEVIFSETLSSLIPVAGHRMCEQCGSMLIIPLPCKGCNGRVIYCSLKCRKANLNVHQTECIGHRIGIWNQIGICFLALRVMLEELPSILPLISNHTDMKELWLDLITPTRPFHTQNNINYLKTLRMVTHEYTTFFDFVKDTKLKPIEWEKITSALVFRHIGQFIVNAHTSTSIIPTCYDLLSSSSNFTGLLLLPELWTKPFHLRRGFLHVFCEVSEVCAVNAPYLSICNHACAPTMRHKFSGRNFYASAEKDIEKGAEIFNCYTTTYRNSVRDERRNHLENTYNFKCTCVYCQRKDPDAHYLKRYLYKCQNPKCRKEFVPNANGKKSLNWWVKDDECGHVPLNAVTCTYCTKTQNFKWYKKFKYLLKHITTSTEKLIELFHIYEMVENILLGPHALKNAMGLDLASSCIDAYVGGCKFTDGQLNKIVKILKFCLSFTAADYTSQSLEYVAILTFLWDVIAMNKYKPTQTETTEMLKAIYILPDEYQTLFLNYYKDYIDPDY
ncbi:SET and MYND domain-containing protein 4-like isoform X2 [Eurosta solidaginis]|uniref:SET and MYND domain-containing protein 4-like isoform X2 n=1 Tax=Eurosta solidaginis TaxID=178769 RepID=UPI0035308936